MLQREQDSGHAIDVDAADAVGFAGWALWRMRHNGIMSHKW
jgi:hypothetical protein